MKNYRILMVMIVGCCCMLSCSNSNSCRISSDIALQISFYGDSIDTLGVYREYVKPIDSLSLWGVGNDSVIYNNSKSIRTISLPLQNIATTTQFAMLINGINDTLTINHTNNDTFVSLECGCFTLHTIENISESAMLFDSISYIDNEIGIAQTENIRLFWR